MSTMNKANLTKIDEGVYVDEDGGMHLDMGEMLTAAGFPDTVRNRRTLEQAARDMATADGIEVVEVTHA